jgi:hypothetical protein
MLLDDVNFMLIISKSLTLYETKIDFFKIKKTGHCMKIVKIITHKAIDVFKAYKFVGFEVPTVII